MTEQKTFKRKVRARMTKTGERYGAARRVLLAQATPPALPWAGEPPVSDDSIRNTTGRSWDEWCAELDRWGAREHSHREIASHVSVAWGVEGWWAQCITVGYERIRGLRAAHQRSDGTFSATASKTVTVPLDALWEAFVDEDQRRQWLADADIETTSTNERKGLRWRWLVNDTRVVVFFGAKGPAKTQVSLEHQKLPDATAVAAAKAFWKERLAALAAQLAG
ncbi:MAG: hypothetical protein ACRD0G_02225 [Acidimicrobiales bacterium]